eukprot:jgi/Chlat1/6380/Chrsp44S05838
MASVMACSGLSAPSTLRVQAKPRSAAQPAKAVVRASADESSTRRSMVAGIAAAAALLVAAGNQTAFAETNREYNLKNKKVPVAVRQQFAAVCASNPTASVCNNKGK